MFLLQLFYCMFRLLTSLSRLVLQSVVILLSLSPLSLPLSRNPNWLATLSNCYGSATIHGRNNIRIYYTDKWIYLYLSLTASVSHSSSHFRLTLVCIKYDQMDSVCFVFEPLIDIIKFMILYYYIVFYTIRVDVSLHAGLVDHLHQLSHNIQHITIKTLFK